MKFYYRYVATYHNDTRIGCSIGKVLTDEEPQPETHFLNWGSLEEMYKAFGMACKFNIWNCKKGRRVSFFTDSFFPKKDEWDVKEWKHPALNIRLEVSYREFTPSISEVLKWHDAEQAINYLLEIGWGKEDIGG